MKFMFMTEGDTQEGSSYAVRCWDIIEEAIHAERWGFDTFGVSEQHFAIGGVSTSAPEIILATLFPQTSHIRFRHAVTLLNSAINHPLKVASRTAVEDILSHGRIELAVGRGNTTLALRAFEVDLDHSRAEWLEGIQVIKKAFTDDPFMFYGEHFKIPPRSLVPKPLQQPHPPMFTAATSPDSHRLAAELGIGVMSWSNFLGWDYLAESVATYRAAAAEAKAAGIEVNDRVGALVQGYCAETDEQAEEEAAAGNLKWLRLALDGYPRLAKMAKDYAYMSQVADVVDRFADFDYFMNGSAAAIFGSPESCIRQIEHYAEIGLDEVVMRIDSVPHDKLLKTIEMFGRHVMPHFKNPANIVRPAEDVIADIRVMREQAKRSGVYVELDTSAAEAAAKAARQGSAAE